MWPITPTFLDALRYSHPTIARVDVFKVDNHGVVAKVLNNVPVMSGSISCDRKNNAWRTIQCDIVLEAPNDDPDLINSTNTRLQAWRGIAFAGQTEWVPLGVFRVDSVSQVNFGALSVSGTSLEIIVVEDRFIQPYLPQTGKKASLEIATLIVSAVPNAVVLNRCTSEYVLQNTVPWPSARWDAILEMAATLVADVYCAPDGTFIIANQPSLEFSPVQWIVDEGPRGVLIENSRDNTRDGVYNAVVASGESSDSAIPPVSAVAYDLDPTSPTYWNGGFGHVPKFFSSQFLVTVDQCQQVATQMLGEARALNKTLTFSAIPNPALEPGDAVMVAMLDGTFEKHILESFSIPLAEGGWQANTLATKVADDTGAGTTAFAMPMMARQLSQNVIIAEHQSRIPNMESAGA